MEKAAHSSELRTSLCQAQNRDRGARSPAPQSLSDHRQEAASQNLSDAIVSITNESLEIIKRFKGSRALDASLFAAAQAVQHYEIYRYGTLKAWANELGLSDTG